MQLLEGSDIHINDATSSYEYSMGAESGITNSKFMHISKCITPKLKNNFEESLIDQIKNQIAHNKEAKENGGIVTNLFSKNKRTHNAQNRMGRSQIGWDVSQEAKAEINNKNYKHDRHLTYHKTFNRV